MLSFLIFEAKTQQYFVSSSCIFLDKKNLLKIWLNPGLNLTIFRGTGPWIHKLKIKIYIFFLCLFLFFEGLFSILGGRISFNNVFHSS